MPHSPQPQRHAGSGLPGVPSSTRDREAGINAHDPQASSLTAGVHGDLLMQLFDDNEDLSEPDLEEEDTSTDEILVEQSSPHCIAAKRSRAASSSPEPPADVPRKRRRVGVTVKEAASPQWAILSSQAAPSEEDTAYKDPKGKGKARSKASSPRKMSVWGAKKAPNKQEPEVSNDGICPFQKDIPATYGPLQDPLEDDELLEFNWFVPVHPAAAKGKPPGKDPKAPVEGTPPPASQAPSARSWYSFAAPTTALDEDLDSVGEVTLLGGSFCFPFEAQVIYCFASLTHVSNLANNRRDLMKSPLCPMSSRQAFFCHCCFRILIESSNGSLGSVLFSPHCSWLGRAAAIRCMLCISHTSSPRRPSWLPLPRSWRC